MIVYQDALNLMDQVETTLQPARLAPMERILDRSFLLPKGMFFEAYAIPTGTNDIRQQFYMGKVPVERKGGEFVFIVLLPCRSC